MRLSDLAYRPPTLGSLATFTNAASTATQIASGDATFDKAFSSSGGSFAGTAAMVAGLAAGLPAGQLKSAVTQVSNALGDVAAGAEMGSVIPGYGTAVGAVVGAVIGIVSDITGGSGPQVQGEFRSQAEQYTGPALPNTPALGSTPSTLAQTGVNAGTWPDIGTHVTTYQLAAANGVTDVVSGQDCPIMLSFTTGWVSPPHSTVASTQAAWALANAIMGANRLRMFPAWNKSSTRRTQVVVFASKATTLLGSNGAFSRAKALVNSWYGTSFSSHYKAIQRIPPVGNINVDGQYQAPNISATAFFTWFQLYARSFDAQNPLDFTYYLSRTSFMLDDQWDATGLRAWNAHSAQLDLQLALDMGENGAPMAFLALPDTALMGLCEIACLQEMGLIPSGSATKLALHYVMALAWLWRRGQIEDQAAGSTAKIENHPNYSRLISRIGALVSREKATTAKKTATAAKHSASDFVATTKAAAKSGAAAAKTKTAKAKAAAETPTTNQELMAVLATVSAENASAPKPFSFADALELVGMAVAGWGLLTFFKRRKKP